MIAEKDRNEFVHELGKEKSKRISLKNHKTAWNQGRGVVEKRTSFYCPPAGPSPDNLTKVWDVRKAPQQPALLSSERHRKALTQLGYGALLMITKLEFSELTN